MHTFKTAGKYGIKNHQPEFNFCDVISHVHEIQNEIYNEADKPEIYEKMGIDVFQDKASFIDKHTISLIQENKSIFKTTSKYFIIAAGGSPVIPEIEGIDEISFHTNETIFSIEELPKKLLILGAGPVGTEMAQAFVRLGSGVIVVDHNNRILQHDDEELAISLQETLKKEGIKYYFNCDVKKFRNNSGKIEALISRKGNEKIIEYDSVLISSGRKPNIDNLNLKAAGVVSTKKGIKIDRNCRTNVSNIFAVGDCAEAFQFTHYAEHMAKKAVSTALLKIPFSIEPDNIVWATYTEPELAHAGLTQNQLKERNIRYNTYKFPFNKIDRALTESNTEGLIKVYVKEFSGKIYGADILGAKAGEMISEFALAIKNNISLRKISDTIHPYPTFLLGNRRAADQWYIHKQSALFVKLLQKLFGYKGRLPDISNKYKIV
jgi:pyruvate/2-oxoglutarate dehydrogenase complex dihydrolipoamide dehydrogenase (E3) component